MRIVPLGPTRRYLALDASGVTLAEVGDGAFGGRLRGVAHEALAPGCLVPRASGPNLADAEAVRAAASRAMARAGRARVRLVLPDGVARIALLEPPPGVPAREFVRYRLAASLPWPTSEGLFEALEAGAGRVVGAAVRRATVAEYEAAAHAAGVEVEQVHLAPLLGVTGLLRSRRDGAHALLGDAAMCLALVRRGELRALRNRRRDRSAGEPARIQAGLERLVAEADGEGAAVPLAVKGSDAGEPGWLLGLVA
jgi:hypothetical protein